MLQFVSAWVHFQIAPQMKIAPQMETILHLYPASASMSQSVLVLPLLLNHRNHNTGCIYSIRFGHIFQKVNPWLSGTHWPQRWKWCMYCLHFWKRPGWWWGHQGETGDKWYRENHLADNKTWMRCIRGGAQYTLGLNKVMAHTSSVFSFRLFDFLVLHS